MTEAEVSGSVLILRVLGLHKIWAFKSSLSAPLRHVAGAALYRDVDLGPGLFRVFGTAIPGIIGAGLCRRAGEWEFWDVMDKDNAVVIELADEWYSRWVVEVEDPDSTLGLIRRAIRYR